jgi:hypothetical protein
VRQAIDAIGGLGASGKRECQRTGQTSNELPSQHGRSRSIDASVAQAPEAVKGKVFSGSPHDMQNCGNRETQRRGRCTD